jgi:hypothetical protein
LSHPQMPYYSFILPSVFVNEAPRALTTKTKSNQSQGREATLSKSPTFFALYLGTDGRVGACGLKPPLLNHVVSFAN